MGYKIILENKKVVKVVDPLITILTSASLSPM